MEQIGVGISRKGWMIAAIALAMAMGIAGIGSAEVYGGGGDRYLPPSSSDARRAAQPPMGPAAQAPTAPAPQAVPEQPPAEEAAMGTEGGEEAAEEEPETEVTGSIDLYYSGNFNAPTTRTNAFRAFDTAANQFGLALAEVVIQRAATQDKIGFRTDLDFGPTTDVVHAAEPGGPEVFKNLQQAYVSFAEDWGHRGVTIDVGKFVTQHGAEVIESQDNLNYTRGLLFTWAIPFYHFGVRVSYPHSDKATSALYLVNGWNNVVDNNDGKTVGYQLALTPNDRWSVVQNLMIGPEQANDNTSTRFLSDTSVFYTSSNGKWKFGVNADYGHDTLAGNRVTWDGLALYARRQLSDRRAWVVRAEQFNDRDGFTTGTAQQLSEVTLGYDIKTSDDRLLRFEYRTDFSNVPVFFRRAAPTTRQDTLTVGLVAVFD